MPVHPVLGICLPPSKCWTMEMNELNLLPTVTKAAPTEASPVVARTEDPKPRPKAVKLNDPIFPEVEGEEWMPRHLLEAKRRGERLTEKPPQPLTDYQRQVCLEWAAAKATAPEPVAEPEQVTTVEVEQKPKPEVPAPTERAVKKPMPTPAKPAAKPKPAPRGYHHAKTTLGLGRKIAHWLADNGGTTKPIAPYRIYRALSLARHRDWKQAIEEMKQRQIIKVAKGTKLKVDAAKLLEFEIELSRKETRKRERRRRPPTQWFLDHLNEFRRRDGLPVEDESAEQDADELAGQEAQESGDDEWGS
jgi:predicted flap endonuclease-1-like 5' DNA nuclease